MRSFLFGLILSTFVCSSFALNSTDVIRARGYQAEDYSFVTSDGFVISFQRIHSKTHESKPVLIVPGFSCSSFIIVVANREFPYLLADAGYDVWIYNPRGSTYSKKHMKYSPSQDQFWDWSFEQIGMIDVPEAIEFILRTTHAPKLKALIGHSEGTADIFIALSSSPRAAWLNSVVERYASITPTIQMAHVSNPLFTAMAALRIDALISILGTREFNPPDAVQKLIPGICRLTPALCDQAVCLLVGCEGRQYWDQEEFLLLSAHYPGGTSTKDVQHWAQLIRSGRFERFDYGEAKNMAIYGQPTPPLFRLDQIRVPITIFYGGLDTLSDTLDVEKYLKPQLPASTQLIFYPKYGHGDFLLHRDAPARFGADLLAFLRK